MGWLAFIFTVVSIWLIGGRRRWGWVAGMVGNVLWIVSSNDRALICTNLVILICNLRGWRESRTEMR